MFRGFLPKGAAFAILLALPVSAREGSTAAFPAASAHAAWGRKSALELTERAARAESRGDHAGALRHYADAIALDPSYGHAYLSYGRLRERLSDFVEAERLYGRAAALRDTAVDALAARAAMRRRMGRRDEAERDLERAVELSGDEQHIRMLVGWYVERGAWPPALALFRKLSALRGEPGGDDDSAVQVRALTLLAAECDPVSSARDHPSWVRRAISFIASAPLRSAPRSASRETR